MSKLHVASQLKNMPGAWKSLQVWFLLFNGLEFSTDERDQLKKQGAVASKCQYAQVFANAALAASRQLEAEPISILRPNNRRRDFYS